jgi:hypothetical protein
MELRERISRSMRGSKKGILLTLLTIVLFILMLGELLTYVVININYSSIASQTASVFSTGNAAANLNPEIYSFLHSSLENSLNSLITFESTPSLRKDNFTGNADGALTSLILNGSVYGHRLVESNLSSFIKSLIKQANTQNIALAITNQSVSIYQSSPFTVSVQYTALATVNSSGGSFTYPLNVTASASLTGKTNLLSAEEGIPYAVYKGASYPQAYAIGPQALAGSRSPYMFVYGKIIYESGTGSATCSGISSSLETPNNILAVYNSTHINQNVCGFGGLLTNLPNSTTPLKPYLVYSGSSIPSQIQAENNQYALLDGPALSLLNISAFNNSMNQGYTYASPYAKSYLQQASNLSVSSSPYGAFSFSPLHRSVASFNGTNGYISTTTDNIFENKSFTISMWIQLNVMNAGHYQDFIAAGSNACTTDKDFEIGTNINTATSNYYMAFCSDDIAVQGNIFIPHRWYYITATWSNKTRLQQLYLNGILVASRTSTGYLNTSTANVCLGGGTSTCWGPGVTMNGSLADVQIYKGVLASYQISHLYQEGINGIPITNKSLVAWYLLNGNANDYSGNNNNGTPTGVAYTNIYNYQGNPILGFNTHQYNTSQVYGLGCNSLYSCNQSALNLNNLPITSGKTANFSQSPAGYIYASTGTESNSNITVSFWIDPIDNGYWGLSNNYWEGAITLGTSGVTPCGGNSASTFIIEAGANPPVESWSTVSCGGNRDFPGVHLVPNTWQQLVGVFNGSYLSVYYEGKLIGSPISNNAIAEYDTILISGTNPVTSGGGDNPLSGHLSNVQIYHAALSSNNIQALYKEGINGKPISDAGLQAWYPLDGNAQDYGPNNYDGVVNNVNFTNSSMIQSGALDAFNLSKAVFPRAAFLNGENGYINAPLTTNNVVGTSISLWFNAANFTDPKSNGEATLLLLGNNGGNNGYGLFISTSGSSCTAGTLAILESSIRWICTPVAVSANKWYNVILNSSASGSDVVYNIYLDGVKVYNSTAESLPNTPVDSTSIGYYGSGSVTNFFFGKLADIQIYNSALSQSQAEQLYLNNSVEGISPIAYWPLSGGLNGTYNVTPDITGNGFNGQLYSNATSQACRSKDVVDGMCGVEYT